MNAWEKFKKFVVAEGLVKRDDSVLVAVSGGPDSVCLLHLFWRLKKTLSLELQAITFDHGLRPQAKREINAVRRLCEKLGVPLTAVAIPVKERAAKEKLSVETAGRVLRYEELTAAARRLGCNRIATGHTASDNAETVLMWLIRGTGADGLAGIPVTREIDGGLRIVRPLMPVTRAEVEAYLKSQGLKACIDRSNFSMEYTRNRIRHRVLPALEECNPRLVEHLFNLSGIMARESGYMHEITRRAIRRCAGVEKNRISLDLKLFFRYNKAIQLRILKEILPEKRSVFHVERLWEWTFMQVDREMELSRTWRLVRKNNTLLLLKTSRRPASYDKSGNQKTTNGSAHFRGKDPGKNTNARRGDLKGL